MNYVEVMAKHAFLFVSVGFAKVVDG